MHRLIASAAAAAAAVVLFGAVSGSAAVNRAHRARTFTVVQTTTSTHVPAGGLSPGSTFTFTADVSVRGRPVGTSQAACVIVAGTSAQCQGTTTLTGKGQIQAQGHTDVAKSSSTVAIVGGTGTYTGARGLIARKQLTPTTTEETYHLGE
jgi:Allene oxide cyclase barrel like domain